jgi:hypothetical protein
MSSPPSNADPRIVHAVPALGAVVVAVAVARTWWARFGYPYDLEWMEGGMLAHAWRLQHGLPLYPEAGPDWLPYIYPPGYAAVLAVLGWGHLDYGVGRAVSIAGVVFAAGCLVWLVGRRGGWPLGMVCAGIFLGCYHASGAFYDLVRPDGLAIALLALAVTLAAERWRRAPELAGIALFLAFTVKHHSAAFGFALAASFWARDGWRAALRFGVASAVPGALFTLALELATGGRFLKWLLLVPAVHPLAGERALPGSALEIGKYLALPVGLAALGLAARAGRIGLALGAVLGLVLGAFTWRLPPPIGIDQAPAWVGAGCAALVGLAGGAALVGAIRAKPDWQTIYGAGLGAVAWSVAGLMRAHNGGFLNVYVPLHWMIAAGFGFGAVSLSRWWPGGVVAAALAAAGVIQLGAMHSGLELDRLVPTRADRDAGDGIAAALVERCHGEILSPFAAWLPTRAGQPPSWHLIALWDVQHPGSPFPGASAAIAAAAREHRWACVVDGGNPRLAFGIAEAYQTSLRFTVPARVFMPKTGWRVRPTTLLVPKETPP